jgi:hypothetical protein
MWDNITTSLMVKLLHFQPKLQGSNGPVPLLMFEICLDMTAGAYPVVLFNVADISMAEAYIAWDPSKERC